MVLTEISTLFQIQSENTTKLRYICRPYINTQPNQQLCFNFLKRLNMLYNELKIRDNIVNSSKKNKLKSKFQVT